ncbi:mitochondrial carrier domain-containing protein [Mycena olivaceomarginata]|nr:mitochondrial carrier domain-containing protein [Mycena olivaceomarginata]
MSNRAQISWGTAGPILFREHATASIPKRFLSLFPGLGYAAGYKVAQRPWFNDLINKYYKTQFTNTFGERKGKMMMQAAAGSLTGIGEVVRPAPLDVLKIKRQVNPEAFRGRGVVRIFLEEGTTLYRGWGWTMARNAPGSFALFGASAVTKEYVLGVSDYSKATWTPRPPTTPAQTRRSTLSSRTTRTARTTRNTWTTTTRHKNFIASIAGAVASITVAAPLDVIKTRIQNANFESKVPGFTVVRERVKNQGAGAFFKGLTPKILVVGPKLVFSYTLAQSLIPLFATYV